MSADKSVHFNQYGEIVAQGYDGRNEFEQIIFDVQQVKAIRLIIQEYNEQAHCQN